MWPMLLDMTRDECKRMLRRLELEAYSAIVSAFRAQGDLSKDKKKILLDLCSVLSISTERHRAEIRRAVNDEHLSTIADHMVGPNTSAEWAIEGRRLIPLMPRLVPQTAFTAVATHVANITAAQNAQMLMPSATGNKFVDGTVPPTNTASPTVNDPSIQNQNASPITEVNAATPVRQSRSPRPASPPPTSAAIIPVTGATGGGNNVVILPSGMSVHVRGQNGAVIEEDKSRKRKRSSSAEHSANLKSTSPVPVPMLSPTLPTPTSKITTLSTTAASARTVSIPVSATPVKLTFTSTPQKLTSTVSSASTQKVILVSGSGLTPSLLQRSLSVPIVKTVTATGTTISVTQPKTTSLIMPSNTTQAYAMSTAAAAAQSAITANGSLGNIVTIATAAAAANSASNTITTTLPTTTVSIGGTMTTAYVATGTPFTLNKPRGIRQKGKITGAATGLMIPMAPQPPGASSSTAQSIQIKPVITVNKPTIQVKNEAGLKIITQTLPVVTATGTTKILPKPTTTNSSGTPVMMVSPSASNISVVTKTLPSSSSSTASLSGTRVVNVITSSQAPSRAASSTAKGPGGPASTVVTVNPRNLQQATMKMGAVTAGRYLSGSIADSTTSSPATAPALIMVGPKALQTTTLKMMPTKGTGGNTGVNRSGQLAMASAKPNLIVVQKAQVMPLPSSSSITIAPANSTSSLTQSLVKQVSAAFASGGSYDKELFSFFQRQGDKGKTSTVTTSQSQVSSTSISTTTHQGSSVTLPAAITVKQSTVSEASTSTIQNRLQQQIVTPATTSASRNVVLVEVTGQQNCDQENANDQKNTVLADILQATGILPENNAGVAGSSSSTQQGTLVGTSSLQQIPVVKTTTAFVAQGSVGSEQHKVTSTELTFENQRSMPNESQQIFEWIEMAPDATDGDVDSQTQRQQESTQSLMTYIEIPSEGNEKKSGPEESEGSSSSGTVGTGATGASSLPFGLQESQLLEIQAAAEILGHEGKLTEETIALLTQAGLDFKKLTEVSVPVESDVASCSSVSKRNDAIEKPTRRNADTPGKRVISETVVVTKQTVDGATTTEVMGELDPQTGIFYPLSRPKSAKSEVPSILPIKEIVVAATSNKNSAVNEDKQKRNDAKTRDQRASISDRQTQASCSTSGSSNDLFSTAIASAQLDLRQYHITEDDIVRLQEEGVATQSHNVDEVAASTSSTAIVESSNGKNPTAADSPMHLAADSSTTYVVTQEIPVVNEESVTDTVTTSEIPEMPTPDSCLSSAPPVKVTRSFAPIDDVEVSGSVCRNVNVTVAVTQQPMVTASTSGFKETKPEVVASSTSHLLPEESKEKFEEEVVEEEHIPSSSSSTSAFQIMGNVVVEPSGLDTTTMTVEDFTSQRVDEAEGHEFVHEVVMDEVVLSTSHQYDQDDEKDAAPTSGDGDHQFHQVEVTPASIAEEIVTSNSQGSSAGSCNSSDLAECNMEPPITDPGVRSSKRRRKAPTMPDESPQHLTGWARLAMGLLQKLSIYRGRNRLKGEPNASHWFLRPVSPTLAPDYFKVIKKPMDFSTVRRKLETGFYSELSEFHADMLLIKSNCELYNPTDHPARHDCSDVFSLYFQEYDRIVDKSAHKARTSSPSPKKTKPSQ